MDKHEVQLLDLVRRELLLVFSELFFFCRNLEKKSFHIFDLCINNSIFQQQGTPGRPSPTGGPPSNNPQTPVNAISTLNPSSQQVSTPATPQQAPSSVQSNSTQDNISAPTIIPPDPVSLARNLLLRDLRYSLQVGDRILRD